MVQPFNYMIPQADPFAGVLQGLKLGATVQDVEAARAKQAADLAAQQQAMARHQQLGQAMQGLMTKQNPTFADYQAVAVLAPKEQSEALLKSWEQLSKEQQANDLRFSGQVLSAFNAETPDIGLRLLRERAEAERNSGRADRAKFWEDSALIAEKGLLDVALQFLNRLHLRTGDVLRANRGDGLLEVADAEGPAALVDVVAETGNRLKLVVEVGNIRTLAHRRRGRGGELVNAPLHEGGRALELVGGAENGGLRRSQHRHGVLKVLTIEGRATGGGSVVGIGE